MIWVLSVLLLLLDGCLGVPVNGSQVAVINTLHETVEGLQKSIEGLYGKIKVVENQLQNGETVRSMHKMVYVGGGGGGGGGGRRCICVLYVCIKAIMSNIASHITLQRCLFTQFVTSHVS